MKYFSMFSGIGGFELGIKNAYNKRHTSNDSSNKCQKQSEPNCVGFSEVNKYAIQIYERQFENHKNYGDATRIIPEDLPDFNFLCGGFPCQAFSIAGKRGGFKDTRGTLFFEIARILSVKRPKLLLLENVKGLLSHDRGRTFGTILSTLSELGYICQWQVLNSKDFGVPQNRERVFIIGHLGKGSFRKIFPIESINEKSFDEVAKTIMARDYKGVENQEMTLIEMTKNESQGMRVYNPNGIATTLASQAGGLGAKTGLYAVPFKFLDRNQKNYQGDYRFTIDTSNTGGILENHRVRRLTPTECERLQGFPDGWTEGLSDSQRYKCLGNAVTVNVIEVIMDQLLCTS